MLFRKKTVIFDYLSQQAKVLKEAAAALQELSGSFRKRREICRKLESLEKEGERLVRLATDEIEKTFILPLDKEDLKEMADTLDNAIDNIEETGSLIALYEIPGPNSYLKDFSTLTLEASGLIEEGIRLIASDKINKDEFVECYAKINSLEHKGDDLYRRILPELMNGRMKEINGKDLLLLIKWKEIFQTLEDTMDMCQEIAKLFERLRIKYR